MIKILLKHFIYEQCIEVLFDGIYKNFLTPKDLRNLILSEAIGLCVKSRKLKTNWSVEAAEDIMRTDREIFEELSSSLVKKIDREILEKISNDRRAIGMLKEAI